MSAAVQLSMLPECYCRFPWRSGSGVGTNVVVWSDVCGACGGRWSA